MHITLLGKDGKSQTIDTKYDIGDVVTVLDGKHGVHMTDYRPLLCDMVKDRYTPEKFYPVEVALRYTIYDITISAAAGVVYYSMSYSNDGIIFPSGSRGAAEADIAWKLDSGDYEADPAVIKWCENVKNKLLNMDKQVEEDPMYYFISDPNPENRSTGNRSLRKSDWRLKQKDWVVMWGTGDGVRRPYILERDWVVNHAFDAKNSNDSTEFMLISEKDIEKYIRERCMSKPLF